MIPRPPHYENYLLLFRTLIIPCSVQLEARIVARTISGTGLDISNIITAIILAPRLPNLRLLAQNDLDVARPGGEALSRINLDVTLASAAPAAARPQCGLEPDAAKGAACSTVRRIARIGGEDGRPIHVEAKDETLPVAAGVEERGGEVGEGWGEGVLAR